MLNLLLGLYTQHFQNLYLDHINSKRLATVNLLFFWYSTFSKYSWWETVQFIQKKMNRPSFVYHTPIFQSLLGFLDGLCWLLHLREKCPHTEVFLVRIFPYSVRIRENTDQKKLRFWTLFTQYILLLQERRSLNPCQHIKAINYCCQVLYRRCFAVVLVNLSMRWTSQ